MRKGLRLGNIVHYIALVCMASLDSHANKELCGTQCDPAAGLCTSIVPTTTISPACLNPVCPQIVTHLRQMHAAGEKYAGINVKKVREGVVVTCCACGEALRIGFPARACLSAQWTTSLPSQEWVAVGQCGKPL